MRLSHIPIVFLLLLLAACSGGGSYVSKGGAGYLESQRGKMVSAEPAVPGISFIQVTSGLVPGEDYVADEIVVGFGREIIEHKFEGNVAGFDSNAATAFVPPANPGLYQNRTHAAFARYLAAEFQMSVIPNSEAYVEDLNFCTYKLAGAETAEEIAKKIRLKYPGEVKYIQYNQIYRLMLEPDDPEYVNNNLWAMKKIEANVAWDTSAGNGVTVAVIDSGIRQLHEDLTWIQPPGYILDLVNNDTIPDDENGHGTHVCGTVGAIGNNGKGVIGVAYECDIIPIKALGAQGYATSGSVATGITLARILEADVINMSLGSYSADRLTFEASVNAWNAGLVIVAAAGNDSTSNYFLYPGSHPHIINVGATTSNDNRASYSNRGRTLDIAAPGGGTSGTGRIRSTSFGGFSSYTWMNGTSMASPHVAGAAALLLANDPSLTNNEIRGLLEGAGDDVLNQSDWRVLTNILRLNPAKALAATVTDFPEVTITSHTDGDAESANFTLTASVTAPNGGAKMRWYIDGEYIGHLTDAPWERTINVVGMIPGVHTFTAEVIDAANLHGYASVEINIALPSMDTPYWTTIQDAPFSDEWMSLDYAGAAKWQEIEKSPGDKMLYFGDPNKSGGPGYYNDDTDALLSPNFNLAGLASPFFKFEMAFELGAYMIMTLRVIDSSGKDDIIGYIGTSSGTIRNLNWPNLTKYEINLSAYQGNVARVEFWMQRYSQSVGLGEGVYIDNVLVSESSAQPVVQMVSPNKNSVIYGSQDIVTNITDDKGIVVKADLVETESGSVLQTLTSEPFTFTIDTSTFSDGLREFHIVAYDEISYMGYFTPTAVSMSHVIHNTPVIVEEYTPVHGTVATPVTLTGSGFGDFYAGGIGPTAYRHSFLYFTGEEGLIEAEVSEETWLQNTITAAVPEGAITGPIYIVIGDIETPTPGDFAVGEVTGFTFIEPSGGALMPMNGSLNFKLSPQPFAAGVSLVCLDESGSALGIPFPEITSLEDIQFLLGTIPFPKNGKYTLQATAFAASGNQIAEVDFWVEKLRGDFNGDRFVTMADLDFLRARLWKTPADPEWIPYLDVDGNGIIDEGDAMAVGYFYLLSSS